MTRLWLPCWSLISTMEPRSTTPLQPPQTMGRSSLNHPAQALSVGLCSVVKSPQPRKARCLILHLNPLTYTFVAVVMASGGPAISSAELTPARHSADPVQVYASPAINASILIANQHTNEVDSTGVPPDLQYRSPRQRCCSSAQCHLYG
jgi:hypothetical protein